MRGAQTSLSVYYGTVDFSASRPFRWGIMRILLMIHQSGEDIFKASHAIYFLIHVMLVLGSSIECSYFLETASSFPHMSARCDVVTKD